MKLKFALSSEWKSKIRRVRLLLFLHFTGEFDLLKQTNKQANIQINKHKNKQTYIHRKIQEACDIFLPTIVKN